MRVDLHPIFNVEFLLCDFYNVDLDERGFYQIRLVPKTSSEFLSIEIVNASRPEPIVPSTSAFGRGKSSAKVLDPMVMNGTVGVSRTVEVSYIDEKLKLDDRFTVSVQLIATTDFSTPKYLTFDVELWFLDRFSNPRHEDFQAIAKRTLTMNLDPSRLTSVARSVYWECSDSAAMTIRAYSAMVSVIPRRRKPPPDSPLSVKLRSYYKAVTQSLLQSTSSIVSHMILNRSLMEKTTCEEEINVAEEMDNLAQRLEASERPWATLEVECVALSARLTSSFEVMVQNLASSKEITTQLLIDYAKWRRSVLSEAFFCREYSKTNILGQSSVNATELFATVAKGKYLQKLPKYPLYCPTTDSPSDSCPIIFEDIFTSEMRSDGGIDFEDDENSKYRQKTNNAVQALKKIKKESVKSLRFLKQKKLEDASTATKRQVVRARTKTLAAMEGLVKSVTENETLDAIGNSLKTSLSMNDVLEQDGSPQPSSQTNSATGATSSPSISSLMTSPLPLQQANETDMQTAVEFIKEREAMKYRLRTSCFYDGFVHSERASTSLRPLPCHPVTWGETPPINPIPPPTHVVVFVHGLGGSRDDLSPYRRALDQAFMAHRQCSQGDDGVRGSNSGWEMEYLMSRVNQTETWSDINTMAHNLLNEIGEFIGEKQTRVRRISFISHSLGGVIVRAAVRLANDARMPWLLPLLHTVMCINTPHLGLAYTGRHINWGVQLVRWWKRSRSMEQLAFRDAEPFTETFLYRLAQENTLGQFRHVVLLGNPEDLFVPMQSALVEHCKASARDATPMGTAYREMVGSLLTSIRDSEKTETLVRYMTVHRNQTANTNKITGRAAHIAPVEDCIFIEKLFLVSALKYFV